uniref:NAD(P)(+)--arginine ADP-ribosyltransferase n=1 Tax=Callorhinchus milii TaxID=7868 RepID=V9L2I7_CALMI
MLFSVSLCLCLILPGLADRLEAKDCSSANEMAEVRPCVTYRSSSEEEKKAKEDLVKERNLKPDLNQAWVRAERWWEGQNNTLKKEHAIALYAYTLKTPLHKDFNSKLRKYLANNQTYNESFPYKSLHYYLSAALEELRSRQGGGRSITLYRGCPCTYSLNVNENKQFEMFTSSSGDKSVAEGFAKGETLFHITTILGVSIKDYSASPEQDEWLIPPCSPFLVTKKTGKVDIQVLGKPRMQIFLSSGIALSPTITLLITVLLTQCRFFW